MRVEELMWIDVIQNLAVPYLGVVKFTASAALANSISNGFPLVEEG